MEIGSIINVKNICFADGVVDHSFKNGRPCIYLGTLDDKDYFVPLVTNKREEWINQSIFPTQDNGLRAPSYPNLDTVIVKDIFFHEIKGCLSEEDIIKVFKKILIKNFKEENENSKKLLNLTRQYFQSLKLAKQSKKSLK